MDLCLILPTIVLFLHPVHGETPKSASQLQPWPPNQRHYYPRRLTCACGVLGAEGGFREALLQWAGSYYQTNSAGQLCEAYACYRVDFIGVGHPYQSGYGNHYTVMGCSDPGFLGPASVEYRMQQNVSLREFLLGYYGTNDDPVARYVIELRCTHALCEFFDLVHWSHDAYHWKIAQIAQANGARRLVQSTPAFGLGSLMIIAIWLVFANGVI